MAFDLEDQRRIEKMLGIRESIVDEVLKSGIPTKRDDREFLLRTMEGLENTVINKTKLTLDEEASKNQNHIQEIVARVLTSLSRKDANEHRDIPKLSEDIQIKDLVEGETDINIDKDTYDNFVKKMSK